MSPYRHDDDDHHASPSHPKQYELRECASLLSSRLNAIGNVLGGPSANRRVLCVTNTKPSLVISRPLLMTRQKQWTEHHLQEAEYHSLQLQKHCTSLKRAHKLLEIKYRVSESQCCNLGEQSQQALKSTGPGIYLGVALRKEKVTNNRRPVFQKSMWKPENEDSNFKGPDIVLRLAVLNVGHVH
jgi:hypothetical protein